MEHEAIMDMDKTKLNTSEVSRMTAKGRTTISRHARAGKISYELDENGHMLFDASEISRVYAGDIKKRGENRGKSGQREQEKLNSAMKIVQDRLISQYESRIAHLEKTLDKALDVTLLLEDRNSQKNNWQASLDATIEKVANQTEKQIQSLKAEHEQERSTRDKELLQLKRALKAEREKSLCLNGSRGLGQRAIIPC